MDHDIFVIEVILAVEDKMLFDVQESSHFVEKKLGVSW